MFVSTLSETCVTLVSEDTNGGEDEVKEDEEDEEDEQEDLILW